MSTSVLESMLAGIAPVYQPPVRMVPKILPAPEPIVKAMTKLPLVVRGC